jgi:hypothetical protein
MQVLIVSRMDKSLYGFWYKQREIKGKTVPLHAMKAPGERGGIAPTHSQPRRKMGVSGQRLAPAALYPRGGPRYALHRRLGGPQSRYGRRG